MSSTRRDFLHAMLGSAAAASASSCKRAPVAGRIVGGSEGVGHLLRTPPRLGDVSRVEEVPIVIVGGGPSGLAAAWRLRMLGAPRVALLELEPMLGGTSTYGTDGVVAHPWGAHYLPAPRRDNTPLLALLSELGAVVGRDADGEPVFHEEMLVRDPEERLFEDGAWHEGLVPTSLATSAERAELERFHALVGELAGTRDGAGRRAFDLPLARSSTDPSLTQLDSISMDSWLTQRGFVTRRLRWYVDYACRDDYGLRVEDASAWAGLFYFASRVSRRGVEAAPLLSWPNGNGRLVEHLARDLGEARRARLVVRVTPTDDGATVLALDPATRAVEQLRARQVIVATPRFVAARIVEGLAADRADALAAFQTGAWLVANVHLRARPRSRGTPLAWDNVLYESPSLGYVVATHQTHVDDGPTVLTYYLPFTDREPRKGRERLLAASHAELAGLCLSELGPAHQRLEPDVERVDVYRWGHGMVQPRPGFLFGGARARAGSPLGAIRFAHTDLSGVALFEEAFFHGVRAADEAFASLYPDRDFTRWYA